MQGAEQRQTEALAQGDLAGAELGPRDVALMRFAEQLTKDPSRTRESDIKHLRNAGWTDEQIAEAVYVIAMFAFFNRVADAFGLTDPAYAQLNSDRAVEPATSFRPASSES